MSCPDLDRFVDGELDAAARREVRGHLAECERCQGELGALMQLEAMEAEAGAEERDSGAPVVSMESYRRRRLALAGIGVAIVAVAAALLFWLSRRDGAGGPELAFETRAEARATEVRFSYGPADRHRPYRVQRAANQRGGEVPLAILAALEERGEHRGLAAGHALNGAIDQARAALDAARQGPEVDSDRAALALLDKDPETALVAADAALAADPELAPAMWNRALALRELGLYLVAAEQLDAVASLGEPGWSKEAAELAEQLRERAEREAVAFDHVRKARKGFAAGDEPLPALLISSQPGQAVRLIYEAAWLATDAADVERVTVAVQALSTNPLAPELERLLERLRATDLAARAPLSRWYAGLEPNAELPASAELEAMRRGGHRDLLFGALSRFRPSPEIVRELESIAEQLEDPWLELAAAERRAYLLIYEQRDYVAAVEHLSATLAACNEPAAIDYHCGELESLLGTAYEAVGRHQAAQDALAEALARARRTSHVKLVLNTLYRLGEAYLNQGPIPQAYALGRAHLRERALRQPMCRADVMMHTRLADWLSGARRWNEAAQEIERATEIARSGCPEYGELVVGLATASEIAIARDDRAAAAELLARVEALREKVTSPALAAHLSVAAGRLELLIDPDVGRARLIEAAALAQRAPQDLEPRLAAKEAIKALAVDAAQREDWERALQLIAGAGRGEAPRCTLALIDGVQAIAVVRGVRQTAGVAIRPTSGEPLPSAQTLVRPLMGSLRGCLQIDVHATGSYYGKPDVLSPSLAWRFVSPRPVKAPGRRADTTVLVGGIEPPRALRLPTLRSSPQGEADLRLEGAAATPARVLEALETSGLIEIHAHGLLGAATPGAELLVLSRGPTGYALTAEMLQEVELAGAPVVILAACHLGRVQGDASPWGLAEALVAAGASAVIASPSPIEDVRAGEFFADVREQIQRGAPPAVALREARRRFPGEAWARAVMSIEPASIGGPKGRPPPSPDQWKPAAYE